MIVKLISLYHIPVIQIFSSLSDNHGLWFSMVWEYTAMSSINDDLSVEEIAPTFLHNAIKMLFEQSGVNEIINRFYEAEDGIK